MADKSPDHVGCLSMYRTLFRKVLPLNSKQKKNSVTSFCTGRLPLELESNILERIPVEPLLCLNCVCKRWRDEIKSPYFIKSHTGQFQIHNANSTSFILFSRSHLYSTNFHNNSTTLKLKKLVRNFIPSYFTMVGSCNGLLCFKRVDLNNIRLLVCNPITGTTLNNVIVPNCGNYSWHHMIGFGYNCMSDDYKIFYSFPLGDGHVVSEGIQPAKSWVYSFKKNSWKRIQPPPHSYNLSLRMVTSNNVLYWIGVKPNTYDNCIFGFDLETEEYHEIIMPDFCLSPYELVNLRGCLHFVNYRLNCVYAYEPVFKLLEIQEYTMDIWVLKNYGSNREWVKLIDRLSLKQAIETELEHNRNLENPQSRSVYSYCHPLPYAYSEDESEILIGLSKHIKAFVCCDLHNGKLKRVDINGALNDWKYGYEGMPWTASLVSISSSTC
ncbi:F-box protein At3g07870-like [Spinacia oleracea]|uniref:F-box protein At3g07870-like n=1 Tax=Spinacia oleracea TaxID=3562 RepID=A0ABM3RGL5_SPIOL|nr:F-box protein At3g07870-like [Spinacia oleracea]